MRRVVITGLGAVTPIGIGREVFCKALKNGTNGIDYVSKFDVSEYPSQMAAEVKEFEVSDFIDPKEAKRLDMFCQFAVASTQEAYRDSGLKSDSVDPHRFGVIFGTGIGGIETFEKQHKIFLEKGPKRVSALLVPMMIGNMASGNVAISLGAKGVNFVTTTACASANHALGEAWNYIRHGMADVVMTGGAEAAITPLTYAGFANMKAFSRRNDEPKTASRPFNIDRDGFVIGEGAGALVLEDYEHAKRRGARIYAEVIGYGATCDAYHITAPAEGGEGGARAIKQALAGVDYKRVSYINAHGTSTPLNDKFEIMGIRSVFKDHSYQIPISSTKSMHGHLLGAAAAIEAVAAILAIRDNFIPPTINQINPDPELNLDFVPNKARFDVKHDVVISNSLGFGGHNATVAFSRFID